jgi:hypothetical protein
LPKKENSVRHLYTHVINIYKPKYCQWAVTESREVVLNGWAQHLIPAFIPSSLSPANPLCSQQPQGPYHVDTASGEIASAPSNLAYQPEAPPSPTFLDHHFLLTMGFRFLLFFSRLKKFFWQHWGLNSGPHTCWVGTPSTILLARFLFFYILIFHIFYL